MKNLQVYMTDATCYDSYICYPTDVKLLWEAVSWLYTYVCSIYKSLGLRKPRTKYDKLTKRDQEYSKKLKRRQVETRVLTHSLLHLIIGTKVNMIQINSIHLIEHNRFFDIY